MTKAWLLRSSNNIREELKTQYHIQHKSPIIGSKSSIRRSKGSPKTCSLYTNWEREYNLDAGICSVSDVVTHFISHPESLRANKYSNDFKLIPFVSSNPSWRQNSVNAANICCVYFLVLKTRKPHYRTTLRSFYFINCINLSEIDTLKETSRFHLNEFGFPCHWSCCIQLLSFCS